MIAAAQDRYPHDPHEEYIPNGVIAEQKFYRHRTRQLSLSMAADEVRATGSHSVRNRLSVRAIESTANETGLGDVSRRRHRPRKRREAAAAIYVIAEASPDLRRRPPNT